MSDLDPASRARVARGEVIVRTEAVAGAATPKLLVTAVIESPPASVWKVIDDSSSYSAFMPRVKDSREIGREGREVRTRLTIEMPFPLKNLSAVTIGDHEVVEGERWVRRWDLAEGDYRRNSGSWTLTPFEGDPSRTLVQYVLHVEPKMRIPKKIASAVQERAMPALIDAVRGRVRTHG
ncbi:MAG: hypothetical protein JKY65_14540 [Planctomycetes bacterium]|nr:hypothetical protein [Planctomycetota bacterium]